MTLSRQYIQSGSYARSHLMWEIIHTSAQTQIWPSLPSRCFFYLLQERCLVLRCTVDPKGTPLRLMVSGFLSSHLRNMPHLDCPGGGCSHGLASGTGPGFVMCFLIFPTILTKNICQGCCRIKCFRPFMVRKLLLGFIFSIYLHSEKWLKS